ncbi:hypothetical protein [Hydrogenovibrio sp. JE_KL2]|uniref:hypothetical protein n=1 Tax=Hydrogenovibrio sp. JE_KL2 TaxID=2651188 RepID=UPI00128DB64F|nr:hypothetical protein [Hydrogenovibrio sp. JE_KL2]MPQ76742.1 hypothetical protein [Hydrogenovibrio sp. JE_KL2]
MNPKVRLNSLGTKKPEVAIGISTDKLFELMRLGVLCGADIKALDSETKQLVQQACLHTCAEKVCRECDFSDVCGLEFVSQDCQQCVKPRSSDQQIVHWQKH